MKKLSGNCALDSLTITSVHIKEGLVELDCVLSSTEKGVYVKTSQSYYYGEDDTVGKGVHVLIELLENEIADTLFPGSGSTKKTEKDIYTILNIIKPNETVPQL